MKIEKIVPTYTWLRLHTIIYYLDPRVSKFKGSFNFHD